MELTLISGHLYILHKTHWLRIIGFYSYCPQNHDCQITANRPKGAVITLRLNYNSQSENVSNVLLTNNALSQENISLTSLTYLFSTHIGLLDNNFV